MAALMAEDLVDGCGMAGDIKRATKKSTPHGADKLKPGPKPKLAHSEQLIEQLRALGGIQATVEEAAAVLRVSERTLQNFFAAHPDAKEAHEDGKRQGLASLRRKQFDMAGKNAAMSIWLGKQYLGQREPVQQIETGAPGDFSRLSDEELDEEIKTLQESVEESKTATQH